jgi:hypothetical protein
MSQTKTVGATTTTSIVMRAMADDVNAVAKLFDTYQVPYICSVYGKPSDESAAAALPRVRLAPGESTVFV